MASKDALVRGYAEAMLSVAEAEDALPVVEDQLFAFAKAMEQNPSLREALTDPALPAENRKAVVAEILGERAHPVTGTLVGLVIDAGRARELDRIIEELARLASERRQHQMAEVRSAVPLTDEQRAGVAEALSRATGRIVEVKVVIDPSVLGGIVAKVGDEVFDGSVRTRLEEARSRLSRT